MAGAPGWVEELARLLREDRNPARGLNADQQKIVEQDRAFFQLVAGPTPTPESEIATPLPTRPSITTFTPTDGKTNDPVTITGEGLGSASAVYFGLTNATFTVVSPSEVTTTVPAGTATGPTQIAVTTDLGTVLSTSTFTVT